MGNVNLLRDLNHINPEHVGIGWSAFASITNRTISMNSTGIVNQTVGSENELWSNQGGQAFYCSGLLMSQPIVDDTPYRVKAYVSSPMSSALAVGYGPPNPTGLDDQVTKISVFPMTNRGIDAVGVFDDILLIPGLKSGHPDFQKPIAFAILIESNATSTIAYHMSVQNLAKTAPQFASSMS